MAILKSESGHLSYINSPVEVPEGMEDVTDQAKKQGIDSENFNNYFYKNGGFKGRQSYEISFKKETLSALDQEQTKVVIESDDDKHTVQLDSTDGILFEQEIELDGKAEVKYQAPAKTGEVAVRVSDKRGINFNSKARAEVVAQ